MEGCISPGGFPILTWLILVSFVEATNLGAGSFSSLESLGLTAVFQSLWVLAGHLEGLLLVSQSFLCGYSEKALSVFQMWSAYQRGGPCGLTCSLFLCHRWCYGKENNIAFGQPQQGLSNLTWKVKPGSSHDLMMRLLGNSMSNYIFVEQNS